MSADFRPCRVSMQKDGGGMWEVHVQARTLYEAAGLALVEFEKRGIRRTGMLQVTYSQPLTRVVDPDKFWKWLIRDDPDAWQSQDIRDKLKDLFKIPLSREEKRQRQER